MFARLTPQVLRRALQSSQQRRFAATAPAPTAPAPAAAAPAAAQPQFGDYLRNASPVPWSFNRPTFTNFCTKTPITAWNSRHLDSSGVRNIIQAGGINSEHRTVVSIGSGALLSLLLAREYYSITGAHVITALEQLQPEQQEKYKLWILQRYDNIGRPVSQPQ